ncbi:MAG: cadherin-like beta sandwich domain-containing protein [Bacilli bacterium]|nr:cadherin-like beta sandwich domain-containing protein [Bacilli bacterium]
MIKKILCSIALCLCFMQSAKAAEFVTIKNTEMYAKPGENIEIELHSALDDTIIGATFTVSSPSTYLKLDSVVSEKGKAKVNQNSVTIENAKVKKGEILAKVIYKVSKDTPIGTNGTIAFTKMLLNGSASGNEVVSDSFSSKVLVEEKKESNLSLKGLEIEEATIAFKEDVLDYKIVVPSDVSKLHINAVASDANATIKIIGNTLSYGRNDLKIQVLSGKLSKEYKIEVTREKSNEKEDVKINYLQMHLFIGASVVVVVLDLLYMKKRK